jgi:nicotinic acid phosphoribosyltransferase
MKKFNQWLSENDEFDREEIGRMQELGLEEKSAREHVGEMISDFYEDAKCKDAMDVLREFMARQLSKRLDSGNLEDWEETLSEMVQEFDLRSNGVFEVILFGAADDEGVMIDM